MNDSTRAASRLQIPRRTTPTWEIELLISGALVFSLFSLRQPLEDYFNSSWSVATELLQPLVLYSYLYAKLVLFVLLITFVVHLAARARWVALVGVHSIYPEGPRWDNLGGGPISQQLIRDTVGDVDEAVERADNQASLVFGYGILAAQLSLMIMVVALLFFSIIALLRVAGVPGEQEPWIIGALTVLLVVPLLIDKYLLPRLAAHGWVARLTARLIRLSFGLTLNRLQQPLNSLITTNVGGKRGPWVLIAVIYSVLALATFDTYSRLDRGHSLRGDALAETERDFGLLPTHYASYRTGVLRLSVTPFIDAEVVRGPYLKLTLPYQARRHDALIEQSCPPTPIEAEDAAQRRGAERRSWQARANCFGGLFQIQLNGRPLPDLEFHRLQGVDDAVDGVLAMIDVRELGPGRHTLQLAHLDGEVVDAKPDNPAAPHVIEFWR
jgi:hypothetical protein